MANERIVLRRLVRGLDRINVAANCLFWELGQGVLQRLMEMEARQKLGAAPHERSNERTTQRNGYRGRKLERRLGTMNARNPKLRVGSSFRSFLEPRKATEQALVAVVREAHVNGNSTRKVDDLVQTRGMSGISTSQVSRLWSEIDERVNAFFDRGPTGQ